VDIPAIFRHFSRRHGPPSSPLKPLTESFRNRVLMRARDVFALSGYDTHLWMEVHKEFTYLVGRPALSPRAAATDFQGDLAAFLLTCSDVHFLDFIEMVFQTDAVNRIPSDKRDSLVHDVNTFLEVDQLPYALTGFVWEEYEKLEFGRMGTYERLVAAPQIIVKESGPMFTTVTEPVLQLLADPRFKSANAEYREALQEYRKADYGDCLTMCGSALESVLKVICTINNWAYSPTDTAAPLLKAVLSHATLDPFFEQPLTLIATIRNRLSKAHGAGSAPRAVPKHVAEYAVNATGAAMLLLARECL